MTEEADQYGLETGNGHTEGQASVRTIRRLALALRPLSAERRIARVIQQFGQETIVTTSFGPMSAVLLHMACAAYPGIRVIHIRHGHETPATIRFAEECRCRLQIELRIYEAPRLPLSSWGSPEFKGFCEEIKVRPMRQALATESAKIWFSGVMHDETGERRVMSLVRKRLGIVAVYPILDWCTQDAAIYCEKHDLPVNRDYFDPCKGPDQRIECGLHTDTEDTRKHEETV